MPRAAASRQVAPAARSARSTPGRLGFPLEEIRTIIDLYDAPRGKRDQLEYVLAQIDERRTDLEQRRRGLDAALSELTDFERRCRTDLRAMD